MKIIEINKVKDFIELKETWNKILEKSGNDVFSTWEWLTIWWKHFGQDKQLLILLAEENNKVIGIAPFMYSVRKILGVSQGIIEFIGSGNKHSAYLDFIIAEKHEKCIQMFFEYLYNISQNWNKISLTDIPEKGKGLLHLQKLSPRIELAHECLYVPLPASYSLFLKNVQSRARKSFKKKSNQFREDGFNLEFVDYSGVDSVVEGLKTLVDLHQSRWKKKGSFSGMFADPKFLKFTIDVSKKFSEEGWMSLYCLEISGEPVASTYGIKYKSKYYSNISGLDSSFLKYDIGIILKFHIINNCIQSRLVECDFLWGTDIWKQRFRPILKRNFNVILLKHDFFSGFENFLFNKLSNGGHLLNNLLKKFNLE